MKSRIEWIDIARGIGIFFIYLVHLLSVAGRSYSFIGEFATFSFLFLAGCAEKLSKEVTWKEYIVKSIKKIVIPLFIFSAISLVINTIMLDSDFNEFCSNCYLALKGSIRNTFFVGGLWFLSCLFVIKIIFYFMRKILKNKWIVIAVNIIIFVVTRIIEPNAFVNPSLFFNIDSALYYLFYFAIGYYSFNLINKLFNKDDKYNIILVTMFGVVSIVYVVMVFFSIDLIYFIRNNVFTNIIYDLLRSLIMIYTILFVSYLIGHLSFLQEIGVNSLYLCGSEYIIKTLVENGVSMIGLNFTLDNPLKAYLYAFIMLVLCNKFLVSIEKRMFKKLNI